MLILTCKYKTIFFHLKFNLPLRCSFVKGIPCESETVPAAVMLTQKGLLSF